MFLFSNPSEHEEILDVTKGSNGSKWVRYLDDLVLGFLVSKLFVKIKVLTSQLSIIENMFSTSQ